MKPKLPSPGWLAVATVVLLLSAGLIALVAPKTRVILLEREIERLGGDVQVARSAPLWLNQLAAQWGADDLLTVFDNSVAEISLNGTAIDDAWLSRLKSFPEIEALDLSHTKVTD